MPPNAFPCNPGVVNHFREFFRLISMVLGQINKSRLVIEIVLDEMTRTFELLRYGLLREGQKAIKKLDTKLS